MNLVFAWAEDGKEIKVDVPLVFKGEDVCPGIQKGPFFFATHSVIFLHISFFIFFFPIFTFNMLRICYLWEDFS